MIEATLFIPLLIIAITQALKLTVAIKGLFTILVALVVGIIVSLIDVQIGVTNITIAQGIVYALGAVGVTTVASKVGGEQVTPLLSKK